MAVWSLLWQSSIPFQAVSHGFWTSAKAPVYKLACVPLLQPSRCAQGQTKQVCRVSLACYMHTPYYPIKHIMEFTQYRHRHNSPEVLPGLCGLATSLPRSTSHPLSLAYSLAHLVFACSALSLSLSPRTHRKTQQADI